MNLTGWTALILAGLFEIGFTTSLKLSDGYKHTLPSIVFLICVVLSFQLMSESLKTLPLSTVYAVWTGIGAIGTAVIGMVFFKENASGLRLGLLGLIVVLIVGLKVLP